MYFYCSRTIVRCCPSQICAVLAAVTEVIRGQGGKETETEYFAALVSAAFVTQFLLMFCRLVLHSPFYPMCLSGFDTVPAINYQAKCGC